ncbi:MAG: hypothetical protein K6A89_11525 [Treponema sp.]|nr:hypothetical protein [Treponema sp.]
MGCSKGGKSGKKDALNISIFTIQQREQPPADNRAYKWIEENFGVTFSWDILVGDKDQRIGLLIADGNLPDLVEVDSEKFQGAGLLRDLKPLVEQYAPNLKKHYESAWKKMVYQDSEKDANGNIVKEHIYSLPNYGVVDGITSGTYYNQNGWWIQKAVLKEFGYPEVRTIDDYFDLIEKYYKKYPTIDGMPTIPFSILTYDWEAFNMWNPPNFLSGNPNDGNGHVVLENGKYVYKDNFSDENAKRWYKMANGYYKRGLIDPASFTDNKDQYFAKVTQGRVLGFFMQGWEFMDQYDNALYTAGKDERTYAPLPLVFDESIEPKYVDDDLPNLQRGYGISKKCSEEKAIKIIQFMDEMLKEENQKVLYWGFEGKDYLIDTDGSVTGTKGGAYRTEEMRANWRDPNYKQMNLAMLWLDEAPKLEGTLPSGYTRDMNDLPWEYAANAKAVDVELWKAYGVGSYKEFMRINQKEVRNTPWYPLWQCNPNAENGGFEEEAKLAQIVFEDNCARKYLPKLIMGDAKDFDKTWDEYVKAMRPALDTWNEYFQQQLDQRVKAYGTN